MKLIITLAIFLSIITNTKAQYFSSGNSPSSFNWNQIKTSNTRIVFEESFTPTAFTLAAYIDSMAPFISYTLNHNPKQVDLLIHNHSAISNGFVSWAPRRTEFYAAPGQNHGSSPWLEHLAIHEYRHIVQIDKLNQGLTRFLSYIIGQQATGGVMGAFLPMWFIEGDAVITETTLTNSGRGRSFDFNKEIKAQLIERGKFSYDKAYMGSFKDYTPNYYQMGYLLTGRARQNYGAHLWEQTINNVGRNWWQLTPFEDAIFSYTGKGQKELYNEIFSSLKEEWEKELEMRSFTKYKKTALPEDDYIEYSSPKIINDSLLITQVEGLGIRSHIAKTNIKNETTKTVTYTGNRPADGITANNNIIVWSEIKQHPRWSHKSWSQLISYNISTGNRERLTKRSRLFAPTIHPQKNRVAAVETSPEYRFYITIIDANTKEKIKRVPSPGNSFIHTPSWDKNGEEKIVCVLVTNKGKALYSLNIKTEEWEELLKPSYNEIRDPVIKDSVVWYIAKGRFSDEIFRLNLKNGENRQVTSSKFGVKQPNITPSNKLVYSHYTSKGYRPVFIPDDKTFNECKKEKGISLIDQMADDLSNHENMSDIYHHYYKNQPKTSYEAKNYSKWNLVNVHSWAPAYIDFTEESIYSGVSVLSQNLLSNTVVTAGYNANPSYSHQKYNFNISYQGFFPVIDFKVKKGDSRLTKEGFVVNNNGELLSINNNTKIDHLFLESGLRIPLNISSRNYSRSLTLSSKLNWEKRSEFSFTADHYTEILNTIVPTGETSTFTEPKIERFAYEHSLNMSNIRRGTSRDARVRMGQSLWLIHRHTPGRGVDYGSITGGGLRVYLPGFSRYHSININNSYQFRNEGKTEDYNNNSINYNRFSDLISHARGYSNLHNDNMYLFQGSYMMPIAYPDISIGSLAYIKRARLNLFFDVTRTEFDYKTENGKEKSVTSNFSSFGAELFTDAHFFRFVSPFTIGVRGGRRSADNSYFADFVIRAEIANFIQN
ncbi:hypothetical protein QA597_05755 [Marinilabiliaceae bacterium ANBcel2]|nr:hypothetical protein [Marinilabiliaceae bacterium ANBcel2]